MKKSNIKVLSPNDILFEDNHLLVVNKAAGLLVQGDCTGDIPLVDLAKAYIKKKYNKPGEVFLVQALLYEPNNLPLLLLIYNLD